MTARVTVQDWLHRLADAAPAAWRHDPIFRGAAIGAGVTLALFLLRVAGPHAPELDLSASRFDPAAQRTSMGLQREGDPLQPPPPNVPRIAPGHPLSDVTIAPTPNGDRFGTFKPGKHP